MEALLSLADDIKSEADRARDTKAVVDPGAVCPNNSAHRLTKYIHKAQMPERYQVFGCVIGCDGAGCAFEKSKASLRGSLNPSLQFPIWHCDECARISSIDVDVCQECATGTAKASAQPAPKTDQKTPSGPSKIPLAFSSGCLSDVPEYWFDCPHPAELVVPICFSDPCLHHANDRENWRTAVEYVWKEYKDVSWEKIPVSAFCKTHHLLMKGTTRCGILVTEPGKYRRGAGVTLKESAHGLFDDPKRYGKYWKDPIDLHNWQTIQMRTSIYKQAMPQCISPFDAIIHTLPPEEMTTLRKIAFVPAVAPDKIPQELKVVWTGAVQKMQSPKTIDPVEVAGWLHQHITAIKPWRFGSGQVARLWSGFLLMKCGYLPPPCAPASEYMEAVVNKKEAAFFRRQILLVHQFMTKEVESSDGSGEKTLVLVNPQHTEVSSFLMGEIFVRKE